MLLLQLIITSGLLLLFLPGLSYALLVQPQQYKPIRQNHLLLAKSTRYTRIISMVPTKQAPVGSTTNESVLTVISDNPPKFDRRQQVITEIGIAFAQKIYELEEFQREHGHCLVPKRYSINPSLGNWVNKQRQNYRRHLMGENTALNEVWANSMRIKPCVHPYLWTLTQWIHLIIALMFAWAMLWNVEKNISTEQNWVHLEHNFHTNQIYVQWKIVAKDV